MREHFEVVFSVPFVHGWQRAGSTRSGIHYTQDMTRADEQQIGLAYKGSSIRKYGRVVAAPEHVPVSVVVDAHLPAPKRWPRNVPKWLKPCLPFTVKPDADNILKLIDGLNGIAWHDDAQVTEAIVHKHTRRKFGVEGTTFTVSWEQDTDVEEG